MNNSTNQDLKAAKLFSTTYCPPDSEYKDRTPIIFVHGIGATNATWKGVKEDIASNTNRKIICVDLRNHGKSEWPDAISLDHAILDLENFMEEQEIPKAILLGHSFGGRACLGLAFKRPDLVEQLILEDASLNFTEHWNFLLNGVFVLLDLIKKFPKTLSEQEAQKLVWKQAEVFFPDEVKNMRKKISSIIPFYKDKKTGEFKCYFDVNAKEKIGNCNFDLSKNPTYNGKSLVMIAEKSSFYQRSDVDELRQYLPNSQEACIIGGTHALHIENPRQFIDVTSKFINGV